MARSRFSPGGPPSGLGASRHGIHCARADLAFAAFVAVDTTVPDGDRPIIGSVSCQRFAGLYPDILQPEYRHYGYIWGVFVAASWRRRGIGKALTKRATDHLRALGCTRAVLNASPLGADLYRQLGFTPGNDMLLDLSIEKGSCSFGIGTRLGIARAQHRL